MTGPAELFWRLFPDVRSHERSRLLFFGGLAALATLAQTLGLVGSEALFLSRFGAERLPETFIAAALLSLAPVWLAPIPVLFFSAVTVDSLHRLGEKRFGLLPLHVRRELIALAPDADHRRHEELHVHYPALADVRRRGGRMDVERGEEGRRDDPEREPGPGHRPPN